MTDPPRNFVDDRHNLYVGWVLGMATKYGLTMEPTYNDNGIITDRVLMHLPHGIDITIVIPPPPDDWTLTDQPKEQ